MEEEELGKPQLPVVPQNCAPNTIKLSDLLDFAVQQVFHEITVLSELLPKKLDADRKISLVQFAHSTRMLFVKLLALVKWVKSSKKFDQCSSISFFLEQQAQFFVDTADRLVHLSREELVYARLPAFQVSSAVDTLTQGTYSRLPLCIRDRFVKKKKITPREQAMVLFRLNQILQYRISQASPKLSPRIKEIRIKNGFVTLVVPGEFEVQLTLLGEALNTKWTLLNIKILVEDYEIGFGTQLVHPLQLNTVHNVLQSRMDAIDLKENAKEPLVELYSFLHNFAQSLQLDVLFCQASQLSVGRFREKIIIEKYDPKERCLVIGYWVQRVLQRKGSTQIRLVPQYRVTISGPLDDDGPLRVRHTPSSPNLGHLDDRSGRLSIDRLLSETFVVRSRERLLRIRKRIEAAEPKTPVALLGQAVPYLTLPLLRDSITNPPECLSVSVNMFTGRVICKLAALETSNRTELRELEKTLYDCQAMDVLKKQLDRLKILLMINRYRNSVAALQVRVISEAQMAPFFKKIEGLAQDRICLQFIKEENYYLVVTFVVPENSLSIQLGFYLISTVEDKCQLIELNEIPNVSEPLHQMVALENITYGPSSEEEEEDTIIYQTENRRLTTTAEKQLAFTIAAVDDRLAFLRVYQELDKKNVGRRSVEEEPVVGGLVLHITDFSSVVEKKSPEFAKNMVRCCLRLDNRMKGAWPFECCMVNPPLTRDYKKGATTTQICTWVVDQPANGPESICQGVADRLTTYTNIFDIVQKFSKAYGAYYHKFCNIVAYTYHKLIIAYGECRDQLLVVYFQPRSGDNHYKITFGHTLPRNKDDCSTINMGEETRCNPHTIMTQILQSKFNKDHNLIELVHYLVSTSVPLTSLCNFSRIRYQSCRALAQIMQLDISFPIRLKCHIVTINQSTVRLVYGDIHLEVALLGDDQVAIRDCSRGHARCAGLHQFFNIVSGGTAKPCASDENDHFYEQERAKDHLQGPLSLPATYGASPAPVNTNLLSVPTQMDGHSPSGYASRSPSSTTSASLLPATKTPIIVSHDTLTRACAFENNGTGGFRSLLDDYLFSLGYIQRVHTTFEYYKKGNWGTLAGPVFGQIRELSQEPDHVRLVISTVLPTPHPPLPPVSYPQTTVSFHLYLDPATTKLKAKIQYASDSPSGETIAILEKYFEEVVIPSNNEFSVLAFVQLLRLTPNGAISSIAQIMQQQMDPCIGLVSMSLHLSYLTKEVNAPPNIKKFCLGVIIDHNTNNSVMLLLLFRRGNEKSIVKLFYTFSLNSVKQTGQLGEQQATDDGSVNSLLAQVTSEVNSPTGTGECAIGAAARQLLERFSAGSIAAYPGSVPPPSVMTGSVGAPVSVPQMGSTGGPVSVGTIGSIHNPGSIGHNPGSVLNPGSNAGF